MTKPIPHRVTLKTNRRALIPKNKSALGNFLRKMVGWHVLLMSMVLSVAPLLSIGSESTNGTSASSTDDHSSSISIHQEIEFTVIPQRLYEALLDSKQFSGFSGRKAQIQRESGGEFSLFDGHIVGRNIELVPNQRIVQVWRVVTWPEGVYSIVRFEFETRKAGTRLIFDHVGFPSGLHDHLAEGWESNYWALLKKLH